MCVWMRAFVFNHMNQYEVPYCDICSIPSRFASIEIAAVAAAGCRRGIPIADQFRLYSFE